jgi:hypothetical protein
MKDFPTSDDEQGRAEHFAGRNVQPTRKPARTLRGDIANIRETLTRGIEYAKNHKGETALYSGLGAVALGAAIALLNSGGGGSSEREAYGLDEVEIDGTIASVSLVEGANIRFEPYVSDETQAPTLIETLDAPVTINANHDLRVLDDTNNENWIGIPIETVKQSYPEFDDRGDNDGIVWVNEQGIDSTEKIDLETK